MSTILHPLPFELTGACALAALVLSTSLSPAQPAATPESQGNVESYGATTQKNVAPSKEIPTLQDYLHQQKNQSVHDQTMTRLLADRDYTGFEKEFAQKPEAGWAEALGWTYYQSGKLEAAKDWFSRAVSLDSGQTSASYGLALIARSQGRLSEAEARASRAPHDPRMRTLLQQICATQAANAYAHQHYRQCLTRLKEAESYGPLTPDQQRLRAWSHYQLGDYEASAREFEALYRHGRDEVAAQGLFYSLDRVSDEQRSDRLARELGGPLDRMVRERQSASAYDRGLFLDAEATAPGRIASLRHIDSPSLDSGISLRQKSGQEGLSRLNAEYLPFAGGTVVASGVNSISVEAARLDLYSGSLPAFSAVGTQPVVPRAYSFMPTTYLGNLTTLNLKVSHQAWFTPYLELGTTPIGGLESVLPTGRLGFVQEEKSGNWGLSVFSHSNTESILSYAGMRDPYSGGHWGRVVETGLNATGYQDLGDSWGVSEDGTLGVLTGDEVKTNQHFSLDVGVGRDLRLDGFQYFVVGPSFFGEHFERNLSGFTLGQGGYFSPEYLAQGTVGVNFLTLEGQPYLVRARFGVGGQDNRQDAAPLLPLAPDGRSGSSSEEASYVATAEVEGVVRLNDHWQLGGALSYDKTANYTETSEMVFLRYEFWSRPAVFSSDLMGPRR